MAPTDTLPDDPAPEVPTVWVAARPFRMLLHHLLAVTGLPVQHLAAALGLPVALCSRLLVDPDGPGGSRAIERIPHAIAAQLVRQDPVRLHARLDGRVGAHRATLAVRALLRAGHGRATIHRVSQVPLRVLDQLAAGTARRCTGRVDAGLQAALVWAETHPVAGHPAAELAQVLPEDDDPAIGTAA